MEMVRQEKLKPDFAKKDIKKMSSDKRAQRIIWNKYGGQEICVV